MFKQGPRDVGVNFLSICKTIGKKNYGQIPKEIENNMRYDTAYEYNGFIQFYNGDTLFVTRATEFSRDFLINKGFKIDSTGSIAVLSVDHVSIANELIEKLNYYAKKGLSKEEACNVLIRDHDLKMSLFLNGESLLNNNALLFNSKDHLRETITHYSDYLNPDRYQHTFNKFIKPDIDNYFSQIEQNDNFQNKTM